MCQSAPVRALVVPVCCVTHTHTHQCAVRQARILRFFLRESCCKILLVGLRSCRPSDGQGPAEGEGRGERVARKEGRQVWQERRRQDCAEPGARQELHSPDLPAYPRTEAVGRAADKRRDTHGQNQLQRGAAAATRRAARCAFLAQWRHRHVRRPPSNTQRTRPAHTAFSATRPRTSSTPTSGRLRSSARKETGCARRLTFDTIAPLSATPHSHPRVRCDAAQARTREDAVGLAPDNGAGANHEEEEVAAGFGGEGAISFTTVSRQWVETSVKVYLYAALWGGAGGPRRHRAPRSSVRKRGPGSISLC